MGKFTEAANTSFALSVAAMEEASRHGQRKADIEHMLLALSVNEQRAGRILRELGITLEATRKAVEEQQREHLALLGVSGDIPEPGRIVFQETSGYDWSERALEVIKRSNSGKKKGDAEAVLRELITEPSGQIHELLHRMEVSEEKILERLDETETPIELDSPKNRGLGLSRQSEVFIPAAVQQVWALLDDPRRMPEWNPTLGSLEASCSSVEKVPGVVWEGASLTERSDGKPLKVRSELMRQNIELIERQENVVIAWMFSYPQAQKANARKVRIELEPVAEGTRLIIDLSWERKRDKPSPWSRPLKMVMAPFYRFALWMQCAQMGSGISRLLRSSP